MNLQGHTQDQQMDNIKHSQSEWRGTDRELPVWETFHKQGPPKCMGSTLGIK